jgi:hypothetical protein
MPASLAAWFSRVGGRLFGDYSQVAKDISFLLDNLRWRLATPQNLKCAIEADLSDGRVIYVEYLSAFHMSPATVAIEVGDDPLSVPLDGRDRRLVAGKALAIILRLQHERDSERDRAHNLQMNLRRVALRDLASQLVG